jgi:adenylate cyclase
LRQARFLRYIVEETLAGRADRIKAYSVGTVVFERDASFDAQSDPVVRIEAGRLRRAEGAQEPRTYRSLQAGTRHPF